MEVIITYFKLLFWNVPGEAKKNKLYHETLLLYSICTFNTICFGTHIE